MTEKLSERLIDTLQTVYALGVSRGSPAAHSIREAIAIVRSMEDAPEAVIDTRDVLGICAPTEEDFPALYALQGKRVKLVEVE